MKIFIVAIFMTIATLAQSCVSDDPNFKVADNTIDPDKIIDPNSNGYLVFGEELFISLEIESEDFADKESGDYTPATRTDSDSDLQENEAPDDYIIVIKNDTSGDVVYESTYATIKSLTEPLTLPAAIYTIQARSAMTYLSPVWSAPEYESPLLTKTIADEKVVTIDELVCKLATIKTQVAVSVDMMDLFKTENLDSGDTPFSITLVYGDDKLVFSKDEIRSGYFAPKVGVSTIDVELEGMYNVAEDGMEASYIPITWKQTITSVMGGQSRYISVKIDNYNSGKVQFKFEVQTWAYDAALGVDIMSGLFYQVDSNNGDINENIIYDKDSETTDVGAPVVSLENGLSIAETYIVSQLMMDIPNKTYSPIYSVVLTPQDGAKMQSVELVTRSTNNDLLDAIATLGYKFDIVPTWSVTQGFDALFDGFFSAVIYDSATGILRATLRYEAVEFINSYKGSHEVVIKATDSSERVSHTSLNFISIIAGGPEVTWRGGYSFDDTHEISTEATIPVIIDFESATGITSMKMSIISEVLTLEELQGIGLQQDMDLINPGECEGGLSSLGFPVKDEVEGKTLLTLDISNFMPMLAGLGAGDSNFEITVGDASGEREVTLKIRVL